MKRLSVLMLIAWGCMPAAPASAQDLLLDCKIAGLTGATGGSFSRRDEGRLVGQIEYVCDETSVFANEVSWDARTLRASGSVLVVQDGLRVTAERLEMDRATRLGTFYQAAGTARINNSGIEPSMFGTMEPEVSFVVEKLEKLGPRKYRLTNGWFSTCLQPNPRWDVRGSSGTITLDERVLLRNAVLRVKGVPVFYLPVLYYPIGSDDRSTGFLLPTYSPSKIRGQGFSNAFFWAINRSHDLLLSHDWFSKAGQNLGANYQFVTSPTSRGNASISMFDEKTQFNEDGTLSRNAHRSYDIRGTVNQRLGRYFQAIARTQYFTDVSAQQIYQQDVYAASQRQRYFSGSITGGVGRYRLHAVAEQRDFYTGLTSAQRMGRLPQVGLSVGQKTIGRSKVYYLANAELSGIRNQADITQPSTNRSLWRFDAAPTIGAPLSPWGFLSANASASWRVTHWTDSLDPVTGTPVPVSVTRPLMDLKADVTGPVVERIFQTPDSGYASKFKHVIEPRVSVQWLSPFDHVNGIINNDPHVDCLVGGNTTVAYSLTNRISARRKKNDRVQQIFWTSISQSYYTQAAASACDIQYQNQSVGQFSSVQLTAGVSPTDGLSGRFQMFIDSKTKQVQSYSGSASGFWRLAQMYATWTKRQFLPNVPGFDNPLSSTHQISGGGTLRSPGGRLSGGFSLRADIKQKTFLEQRVSASYSAQCCGISVDYQVYNLSHLSALGIAAKADHRFNFSVTLAGIGSFSNPLGSFGR